MLGIGFLLLGTMHWGLFSGATQGNLDNIVLSQQNSVSNQTQNPTFIFGNFYAAATAIGGLLVAVPTGGVVADLINALPIFSSDVNSIYFIYPIRVFLSFSSVALLINIVSNREI